ncbi:MAG: GH3 auxin-responsive promoter family protein [Flavobacteriales bacterium]|nr:GH3 auxin-responsive promoter family protein [Flavobacteriales bacterium]MCW8913243.1 GH3 auxin-responsive promoter family protein [Flavobacteriales bacterium]MCW8936785.1 GH3 auxin-responsive promoter family protein [Flavobacteriales bacterium]MCW8968850.1 GH3 auxin-responsive promoter family protein [Flavobacteriales bacterium]MCW8989151.1 GH3 auxin-responsive promoter family protein [Flavobacteriales bacterium]
MEIINSVFSWFIKKRIHQMELFMKYPINVQHELLSRLLIDAKNTEWGKQHDYKNINNYQNYINNVPLQSYEDIEPLVSRIKNGEQNVLWPSEIKWFAKSSGTSTGKSKFIPVSKESLENCHYKGGKDLLAIYHHNHPNSKLILGKTLVVGGSSKLNKFNGDSYFGDLSAIIMKNFPFWVEIRRVPELAIALMEEWEEKIEKMAISTSKEDVSNISGVPSWTLILLKKILELNKTDNLLDVWPNLELYMHGGINFSPYQAQFEKIIPSKYMNYYESYNASEGYFGIQDQVKVKEMLLMLDYGIFYEFIPIENSEESNPKTYPLEQVELNKIYEMVISTNAGLWRYRLGDTVQFTSIAPFRIKVAGRTKHFINAFGEELMIHNAEKAIAVACEKTDTIINEFTAAPVYFESKKSGKHQWLIEFEKTPDNLSHFTAILDEELKNLNSDYEAKRHKDIILSPPELIPIAKGTFHQWLKSKNKLGGQHKIPRLSNNRNFVEEILQLLPISH